MASVPPSPINPNPYAVPCDRDSEGRLLSNTIVVGRTSAGKTALLGELLAALEQEAKAVRAAKRSKVRPPRSRGTKHD